MVKNFIRVHKKGHQQKTPSACSGDECFLKQLMPNCSSKKRQEIEAARMRLNALKLGGEVEPKSPVDPDIAAFLGKGGSSVNVGSGSLPTFKRK